MRHLFPRGPGRVIFFERGEELCPSSRGRSHAGPAHFGLFKNDARISGKRPKTERAVGTELQLGVPTIAEGGGLFWLCR